MSLCRLTMGVGCKPSKEGVTQDPIDLIGQSIGTCQLSQSTILSTELKCWVNRIVSFEQRTIKSAFNQLKAWSVD